MKYSQENQWLTSWNNGGILCPVNKQPTIDELLRHGIATGSGVKLLELSKRDLSSPSIEMKYRSEKLLKIRRFRDTRIWICSQFR